MNLNQRHVECVKLYADSLRKTIRLLTIGIDRQESCGNGREADGDKSMFHLHNKHVADYQ